MPFSASSRCFMPSKAVAGKTRHGGTTPESGFCGSSVLEISTRCTNPPCPRCTSTPRGRQSFGRAPFFQAQNVFIEPDRIGKVCGVRMFENGRATPTPDAHAMSYLPFFFVRFLSGPYPSTNPARPRQNEDVALPCASLYGAAPSRTNRPASPQCPPAKTSR